MIDPKALLELVRRHGPCIRVVTAAVKGSGPREVGAAMVVWQHGQSGTIGGGALEFEACSAARQMLQTGVLCDLSHHPLGPALGQCCGGAVTLISERIDEDRLSGIVYDRPFVRRISGDADMPFSFKRALSLARAQGQMPRPAFENGWFMEPLAGTCQPLWIWGAGHVGRACVDTLYGLPNFDITWIDTAQDRFPDHIPDPVTQLVAQDPVHLVQHAPTDAQHLIVTYSHALDLGLCHQLLQRGFRTAGLIGSATKWTRFQKRLQALGHGSGQIARITCPIGDPSLGKHPQAIAIGVARALLIGKTAQAMQKKRSG